MLFFRRNDIGIDKRAAIALEAIVRDGVYGAVTDIAEKHGISRPFVYALKNSTLEFLSARKSGIAEQKRSDEELAERLILLMRFCCKSSIGGISEALKILGLPRSSIGYISEFLKSKAAPGVEKLPAPNSSIKVMADEIFVANTPVLVIMEAFSHVILASELSEDRSGEAWRRCFESLMRRGYDIKKIAKDLGSGMTKGISGLAMVAQADVFHLLKKFDPYLGSIERAAFSAIECEDNAFNVLWNRKSEMAIIKQMEKCELLSKEADIAVSNCDNYDFLHKELHAAFDPFGRNGGFRDEDTVRGDVEAALDLLEEVFSQKEGIMKAATFLRKHLAEYMPYVREVEDSLNAAAGDLQDYLIREVCLHYGKSLKSMAVKNYAKSKSLGIEAEEHLKTALLAAGDAKTRRKVEKLAKDLSECVRSSSALEAKNSVIRSFFNSSSSQVTQEHLRLITFYLNQKVAIRGKYKGKSPLQRLGIIQKNTSFLDALAS